MAHIPVYEGDRPYIFISYAHANTPAVMEVVDALRERGFRIWYDDGIEVGSEWPEYIAGHLTGASLMVAFLSNAYMRSDNCRKEMNFALNKRIPTINIFLEDTRLTPGMEMQIGPLFALMKHTMSDEVFYEKLFAAPQLDTGLLADAGQAGGKKRRRPKRAKKVPIDLTVEAKKKKKKKARRIVLLSVLLALLIACVVLGIIAYSTGLAQRLWIRRQQVEVVTLDGGTVAAFQSPLLETAARDYAGIPAGDVHVSDLTGLSTLYLFGGSYSFQAPEDVGTDTGAVQELSDLAYFPDLTTLALINQPLSSLASLPACGIEYLSLTGCRLSSLQGIGNLPKLREIVTEGCAIRDLGDLGNCLQLRRMSLLGADIDDFSPVKPLTRLAEVSLSNCAINELRPLLGLDSLTDVAFYDCDLRGSFFKSFDREWAIVSLTLADCKLNATTNLDDFTGLTTLTLIRTGENLDWSALASLPKLKTVYADGILAAALQAALDDTQVTLQTVE